MEASSSDAPPPLSGAAPVIEHPLAPGLGVGPDPVVRPSLDHQELSSELPHGGEGDGAKLLDYPALPGANEEVCSERAVRYLSVAQRANRTICVRLCRS